MARAVNPQDIAAEAAALGRAIGLLRRDAAGGLHLDKDFFGSPGEHVARLLADAEQRDAVLEALDLLLPHTAEENGTRLHPLVPPNGVGGVYLGVTPEAKTVRLDLVAVARPGPAAPRVTATVPLVLVRDGSLVAVTGSADHPVDLAVAVRLPDDGELAASLAVAADAARFRARLRPGPGSVFPPLDLDPVAAPAGLAPLAVALVDAVLSSADQPADVRRLAAGLTGLLGLDGALPPLPVGDLVRDPAALRGWLARLAATTPADGGSALVAWLRHVGGLLGGPPPTAPATGQPGEDNPVVLHLTAAGASPAVTARVWLRPAPDSGTPVLVAALSAELPVPSAGVAVVGEAVLLTVPLSGTAPTALVERVELTVRRTAAGPVVPVGGAGFGVGDVRVGLRHGLNHGLNHGSGGPAAVVELRDVVTPEHVFPRLDLTDARGLGAAAVTALGDALDEGLGAAGPYASALRTLLGLGGDTPVDLGLLTTAPTRALADRVRRLRRAPDGWRRLLAAVGGLLGSDRPDDVARVTGAGTAADPWVLPLDWWPAATAGFGLALWDEGDAAEPRLRFGLRLRAASAPDARAAWAASARAALLAVDLPEGGGGTVAWLGAVHADLSVTPPAEILDDDLGLTVGAVRATASWRPGAPLTASAELADVTLSAGDEQVALGTLRLPAAADALDASLGLPVTPEQAVAVLRAAVARAARSWGGPGAELLPALFGAPALAPPDPDDAGSLLDRPLDALREWAAALVSAEAGLAADGLPYLAELRRPLAAFLTDRAGLFADAGGTGVEPGGRGTAADPWTVPLQPQAGAPVELLAWALPDGAPGAWAAPAVGRLLERRPDAADVADAAAALAPFLDADTAALGGATAALELLAATLGDGDGVVPLADAGPWTPGLPSRVVAAAHHRLPRASGAVEAVLDEVGRRTAGLGGTPWSVVLVAPSFAGDDCWTELLAAAAPASVATADLRAAPDPLRADLGAVGAASYYVVRLNEDDRYPAEHQAAQLRRVLDRVAVARPGVRTVLVAHSVAGVAARRLVADLPAEGGVLGLVTLGTPLAPVDVTGLAGPDVRSAARLVRGAAPDGLDAPGTDDMLVFLAPTPDDPPPAAGPADLPAARFAAVPAEPPGTGSVPVLAVAGRLPADLTDRLGALVAGAAVAGSDEVTHLGHGVRIGLPAPGVPGAVRADADVRLDLGRVPLVVGAPEPQAPATGLTVRIALTRADGPLLDTETGAARETGARVGSAELAVAVTADGAVFDAVLRDAALDGRWSPSVRLGDARAEPLLARLVAALGAEDPAGGSLAAFRALLADLGLTAPASDGAVLVADAFRALADDPAGFLGPRLVALLDRAEGLYGLARDAAAGDGAWRWRSPDLPVELAVAADPWRVTVRTVDGGLRTSGHGRFEGTGEFRFDGAADADAALSLAGARLERAADGGPLLRAPWLTEPVPLRAAGLRTVLAPLALRLVTDVCLTGLLERAIPFPAAALSRALHDPAGWLLDALLDGTDGTPDAGAVNAVLAELAGAVGLGGGPDRPLALPGGLTVRADATDDGTALSLATATPLNVGGAALTLAASVALAGRHAVVGGTLGLDVPLPGSWGSVRFSLGQGPDGTRLSVGLPGANAVVQLLPTVSGVAELVSAQAARLLPEVLDGLTAAAAGSAPSPLLADALAVAEALGAYDPAAGPGHGFAARGDRLARLAAAGLTGPDGVTAASVTAAATLLGRLLGPGVTVASPEPGALRVTTGVLGGTVTLDARTASAPAVSVALSGLTLATPAAGRVTADVAAGWSGGALTASARLGLRLDTGVGLVLTPRLDVSAAPADGRLTVEFRPLGDDQVVVPLAPVPAPPTVADAVRLARAWIVPPATKLMLDAAAPWLTRPLWRGTGAKTAGDLLRAAKVVDAAGALVLPPPEPATALRDLIGAIDGIAVPLPGGVRLATVRSGDLLGLRLSGTAALGGGDIVADLHAGLPAGSAVQWADGGGGVSVLLLDVSGAAPRLAPRLRLGGVGLTVRRRDAAALVDAGGFRVGRVSGFVRADIALPIGTPPRRTGAGAFGTAVVLGGLGLPLLAPPGPPNDPVAGSILAPGGGDAAPANPPIDVVVATGPNGPQVVLDGADAAEPHWLRVQRTFGPLHLDQIGLAHRRLTGPEHAAAPDAVAVYFDGGVALAGMAVEPDGLRVLVPLAHLGDPGEWEIGLDGIAMSLELPGVRVAGGLSRVVEDGQVEYDGAVTVDVAGRGFTAIGGFSRAADGATSLFVFASLGYPLGGPPYLFVEGLAGGVGYNRALVVPTDPVAAASFPLVQAIQHGDVGQAQSPETALAALRKAAPARRGSHWIAAGVRFTSFELVHTTAVVYAALDRGFQVGLLGVSRMTLPMTGPPIANVELAVNARYDSAEELLSIRAQLTDNSWLLSRDCQLTGGFAFVIWFRERRFVLTIGGYSPWFDAEGFPAVPRVGLRWAVSKEVSVKGETYFALVPGFVMFGGRIEAAYATDIVRVWFTAWLDVLIGWDPFYYRLDLGIEVGASFRMRVCVIACVTVKVSVSLSASLQLEGPPLHGKARVDLAVASVTVHIGKPVPPPPSYLTWLAFSGRYLAGPAGPAVVAVSAGAAADPGAAAPPDGTQQRPWLVQASCRLRTETRVPATRAQVGTADVPLTGVVVGGAHPIHPTPCGTNVRARVRVTHQVTVTDSLGAPPPSLAATPRQGGFQTALWQPAPGPGDRSQNTDALPALGGLDLDFITAVAAAPVTARPGPDVNRVSLPFASGSSSGGPAQSAVPERIAPVPVPKPVPVPEPEPVAEVEPPALLAVVRPGGRRALRPVPGPARASLAAESVDLEPGSPQVWRVSPSGAPDLTVEQGRVRVVCVAESGNVLADRAVDGGAFAVPTGTSRVVVHDEPDAADPGWHLGTPLAQILPGAALGGGATLLPDGPVPMPTAAHGVALLTAADLLRGRAACRTLLPPTVTAVTVVAEPTGDGTETGTETGMDLMAAVTVDGLPARGETARTATGVRLLLEVPARDDTDRPVEVDVALPEGWRPVAVHGTAPRATRAETRLAARAPASVRWTDSQNGGQE
ncbi:DUF6603 domain-containing protein [Actinomadura atramentaria]|uniref:DUF6603 domain-containing protein n=1 Tax=Actinomadura atramentaria TaxID=1990 RepID=UPI00036E9E10|nr:DUF6603 domain-containing protein [Actinomadura atramentaria]